MNRQHAARVEKERLRLEQEMRDAKVTNAVRVARETEKAKTLAKIAKSEKPVSPFQSAVTTKLTTTVTEQLGAMIRVVAAQTNGRETWVSADKVVARDVLLRAYPLALQIGIMAVPNDRLYTLDFANGGRIDFSWPGKHVDG